MTTFASADEMSSEVITRLTAKLNDSHVAEDALSAIVTSCINEVETIRNYPSSYSDEMIWSDMSRFFNNVMELSLYDYNQIGVEGETGHTENGVTRSYKDRNACLKGVRPISTII